MEKDNPNVYEIHDQVCKCQYAREIKFIQFKIQVGAGFKNNANIKQTNIFQEEFSRLEACKVFKRCLSYLICLARVSISVQDKCSLQGIFNCCSICKWMQHICSRLNPKNTRDATTCFFLCFSNFSIFLVFLCKYVCTMQDSM